MTKTPNILETMNGPFQPWFRGASWDGWRAVLKATAALPMTDEEVAFFKSVAGGREPPRRRPREIWIIAGRRGGKDSAISLIAAHAAATFDPRGLRPGERALVACIAPDRDTGKIVQGYIEAYFQKVSSLRKMVQRETDDVMELKNSVDISVMTSSARVVRGRAYLCAILDEVAFLRSNADSMSDVELVDAAILPGMSSIPQAQLFGISTPHAKSGVLYQRYAKYFGQNDDDVLVIQAPSHVLNPALDTRDRDRGMEEDPARARAEWLAEFRTDLVAFIDPAVVSRCVVAERSELLPVPGIKYTAAVDPSGGSSDSMTLAIAHADGDRGVLDLVREWPSPFSPEEIVTEIVETLRRYSVKSVVGDRYAGIWVQEKFRVRGVQYDVASLTRSEAYLALLPQINSGKVELLDHQRMIAQLCALERRTTRSGRDSVDHPRNGKDDVINAAALALVGASAAPNNSAANWIEYLRREAVLAGIERDDVIANGPNFGFDIGPAKPPGPTYRLLMPRLVDAAGGRSGIVADGHRYFARFEGDRALIEVPRGAALELLAHELWRGDNQAIASELVGGGS